MKMSSPVIVPFFFLLYILYFNAKLIGVFIISHNGYILLKRNNTDSLVQAYIALSSA